MLANSVLPCAEKGVVVLFLSCNASLIFNLSKFGSSFFVHFVLEVTAHGSVTLSDLTKDVCLVCLLVQSSCHCLLFVGLGLSEDLLVVLLLLVVLEPFGFGLQFLLEQDVLFTIVVNVLHQVDAGLVLTTPLSLLCFPLFDVLVLDKLFDHLLVGCLIFSLLPVVFLELDNLLSEGGLLGSFKILNVLFPLHSSFE